MNRRMMMAVKIGGHAPSLPSEYQRVEYIASDGGQYIDTGIIASSFFSSEFEINLKNAISGTWNGTLTGYGCAFGARRASRDSEIQVSSYATNSSWTARFGNRETSLSNYRNQRVNVFFNMDGKNVVRIGETDFPISVPWFGQSNNVYLFALNNAGLAVQNSIMDFYGGKVFCIKQNTPFQFAIGSMDASTGAPQASTTRIVSDYFCVSEGTVVALSDNQTNMVVHPFDKDTGLSIGASTGWISSYTATSDCALRVLIRKTGNATISASEVETLSSLLQITNNTVLSEIETKRNFIPCYRKANEEIGLYDLITKEFFTNKGTGTFTKGADIN